MKDNYLGNKNMLNGVNYYLWPILQKLFCKDLYLQAWDGFLNGAKCKQHCKIIKEKLRVI